MTEVPASGSPGPGVLFVRYGIPLVLVVLGLGFLLFGGDVAVEAWAGLTGAGLSVLLLNVLYRIGVRGDAERDREEEARDHFAEHGEWPGEEKRSTGRRWNLPQNVATPESEAAEAARHKEG